MSNAYLDIRELEKLLGVFHFGPLSLEMENSEYLVLLGPTGSGKTSLLRGIAGFLGNARGEIALDGERISSLPPHRRRLGYVSQTGDLFPHLTVKQNILFGTRYLNLTRGDGGRRVDRFLQLFNLGHLAARYPAMLSGGEVKRTSMARSLITSPKMLLLDEPLAMLDFNARKDVLRTLQMIHDELKTTTIHVTHDRHEAWSVGQSCAVMNNGMILQKGHVTELFRQPRTRFTAEFLGGVNIFRAVFQDAVARLDWAEINLAESPGKNEGWIMLRPEHIHVVPSPEESKVSGTVETVRDLGEFAELHVRVGDGDTLIARTGIESLKTARSGSEVFLNWDERAAHPILND
jgi:spermidine/putrescine transport system ATP-binding protein